MDSIIPSPSEVRACLTPLSYAQMRDLARDSGVPFTTLWKVRSGETTNPGIDTVARFWSLVPRPIEPPSDQRSGLYTPSEVVTADGAAELLHRGIDPPRDRRKS